MRRVCQNVCHKGLAIWVCILLSLIGVPTAPAWAVDPAKPTTMPAIEAKEAPTGTQDTSGKGPAEPADDVTTYMSGTLSRECKTDDGLTYNITVSFDESACIPEGAELRVELPGAGDDAARDNVEPRVERALALENDDRILTTDYLAVSIEAGGHVVSPAAAVNVEVQTDAIEPSRSAFVEVVVMGAGKDVEGGSPNEADAFARADNTEVPSDDRVIPQNVTDDKEDARVTKLSFPARSLGTIALASVATRQDMWSSEGLAMSVLAPRQGLAVSITDEATPELEKGMDCLACYAIQAEPRPAYGTSLWLEALPSEEVAQQKNERPGGVLAYLLDDEGDIRSDPLCGPEGLKEPMELSASSKLLLVRDSGYRSTTLNLAGVTVEGMMPEGTKGMAHEVTQEYAKPEALMVGLDKESARAVEAGTLEVAPLAAYDITLETGGKEYQPDEDHPLTVTITNSAIDNAVAAGKNVQVWHIADDGTVEVIEDFTHAEGSIMFRASGFSTYLLVTKDETSVIPEGYKKLTNIYTVAVDGTTPIANVLNSNDDGGIISNVEGMKLTKGLDNDATKNANDSVSFEVSLVGEGDYADKTRAFEFELTVPEGTSQPVQTAGNNESVVSTNGHVTFTLAHGQTIRFTNVPKVDYTLSQTKVASYEARASSDDSGTVTVDTTATDENKFVIALSQISGTSDNPTKVTITNTNTLENTNVPATGIDDNVTVWVAIIAGSVFLMALVWRNRHFVR